MKGFNQNVNTGNTLSSSKMFRSSGALRVLITGDMANFKWCVYFCSCRWEWLEQRYADVRDPVQGVFCPILWIPLRSNHVWRMQG